MKKWKPIAGKTAVKTVVRTAGKTDPSIKVRLLQNRFRLYRQASPCRPQGNKDQVCLKRPGLLIRAFSHVTICAPSLFIISTNPGKLVAIKEPSSTRTASSVVQPSTKK